MRKKRILSFLLLSGSLALHAREVSNELVIRLKSGEKQSFQISDIRTITFPELNFQVNHRDETVHSYLRDDVQQIEFGIHTSIAEQDASAQNNILIYPNPVKEILRLSNLPDGGFTIRILSFDGRVVYNEPSNSAESSIDVSSFAEGFYIITINGKSFKFRKS